MMSRKLLPCLVLTLSFTAPAGAASNMTLEFHEPESRPKTLFIVPVQANLTISRVGNDEPVVAESMGWESATSERVTEVLTERGYQPVVVTPEQLDADPELRRLIGEVNSSVDDGAAQIKTRDIVERRYNMGSDVRALAKHTDADAILVTRVSAQALAGGAAVMSALVGGSVSYSSMVTLVLDGMTGDVEAQFGGNGGPVSIDGLKAADEKVIGRMVKRAYKKYPKADASVKINKKTRKRAVARQVEDDGDDEMLSELEDLLEVGAVDP